MKYISTLKPNATQQQQVDYAKQRNNKPPKMSATTATITPTVADIIADTIIAAANVNVKAKKTKKESKPKTKKTKEEEKPAEEAQETSTEQAQETLTEEAQETSTEDEKPTEEPKKERKPRAKKATKADATAKDEEKPLKKKTIAELKEYCKTNYIPISGKTKKDDIIQAIQEAEAVRSSDENEPTKPLQKMSVAELKEQCKKKMYAISSKMKKDELIALLQNDKCRWQKKKNTPVLHDQDDNYAEDNDEDHTEDYAEDDAEEDETFKEYSMFIKECVWHLLVNKGAKKGTKKGTNTKTKGKKTLDFNVFLTKYKGSFDKMVRDITRETYRIIMDENYTHDRVYDAMISNLIQAGSAVDTEKCERFFNAGQPEAKATEEDTTKEETTEDELVDEK